MIPSLLLAVALLPQGQKLTLNIDAMTVEKAFAKISQAAGVELTAQRSLGKEIVVLRLKDADFGEVRERLGQAIVGHWEKTEAGYKLVRSDADTKPMRDAVFAARLATVKDALKSAATDLQKAGALSQSKLTEYLRKQKEESERSNDEVEGETDGGPPAASYNSFEFEPDQRFMARLLLSIGAERLARIEDRAVFATRANSLQISLSVDPQLVRVFYDEHNAQVKAYQTVYPPEPPSDDEGLTGQSFTILPRYGSNEILKSPPAKVLLGVQIDDNGVLSASMKLFDDHGDIIISGGARLGGEESAPEEEAPATNTEPVLEVSPLAKELTLVLDNLYEDEKPEVSPELRAKLLHTEQIEPLSLLASEVLFALGERKNENVVACLPDDTIDEIGPMGGEPLSPSGVMSDLNEYSTDCIEKDGWLVISPKDPVHSVANRADRKALGRLLQVTQEGIGVGFNDYAAFALASGNDEPYLESTLMRIVSDGDSSSGDWNTLKFYASLAPNQRLVLLNNGTISIAGLSGDQKDLLSRILTQETYSYGYSHTAIAIDRPVVIGADGDVLPSTRPEPTVPSVSALSSEPTEFLANGLNPDGWIRGDVNSGEGLDVKTRGSRFTSGYIGSIAMQVFATKHPEFADPDGSTIEKYRIRTDRNLTISVHLRPGLERYAYLAESLHEKGPGRDLSNLTPELQKQLEDYIKELEEELKNGELAPPNRSDQGKSGVPPPLR